MSEFAAALAARIAREGPLTVAQWMEACLADAAHGYYRRAAPIGAAGDFITAPEVSQIFGELVGAWAAATWDSLGRPTPVRLVELGPGRGTLLADALRALAKPAPEFLAAIDLHLIEINPTLRALQAQAIGRQATWHDDAAGVPPGAAIVIANEFLDALPVRQLVRAADGWRERVVAWRDGRFVAEPSARIADPPLDAAHARARDGDVVELGVGAQALVAALARRLARDGGATLFVDYGPAASGIGDTLQALSRHEAADPFARPGEVDLTAHVDFAALARVAAEAGVAAWGPAPQGAFLARLGLHARAAALAAHADEAGRRAIEAACARLIGESQMGTLFKAFALTPRAAPAPPGFDAAP